MWGRRESPEPIKCDWCRWKGMVRQLDHGYEGYEIDGEWDTEPVDNCPKCGAYL